MSRNARHTVNVNTEIAKAINRDSKDVAALTAALATAIREHCGSGDTIAIPGFGSFEGCKRDESIVRDPVSGKYMMLPPEIELVFHPAASLRKKVRQ